MYNPFLAKSLLMSKVLAAFLEAIKVHQKSNNPKKMPKILII